MTTTQAELVLQANQKFITGLDGKVRVLTFCDNGQIRYHNIKNGKVYGSSYDLNTKDYPVAVDKGTRYLYRKSLPKWITKEMIAEANTL